MSDRNLQRDNGQGPSEPNKRQPSQSELGNADLLVSLYGAELRFCGGLGWLAWDGRRWLAQDRRAQEMAKKVAHQLLADRIVIDRQIRQVQSQIRRHQAAGNLQKADAARLQLKQFQDASLTARQAASRAGIAAMLDLAKSDGRIYVEADQLDADQWLLNVRNGTIDLRTGLLRPHSRDDLITKLIDVNFDPNATAPTWLAFVKRIMGSDESLIAFMQRLTGYMLTGEVGEQVMVIALGGGRNGKSVYFNTVQKLLSEYAGEMPARALVARVYSSGTTPELAQLKGKRLVCASELDHGEALAEARVKAITGGDPISANPKYKDPFQFYATFKLVLRTNHLPKVNGDDEGIWRRLLVVPFDVTIPEEEVDSNLQAKLEAELPGILAWAVQGCMDWRKGCLLPPEAVKRASTRYRAEMDTVSAWLETFAQSAPGDYSPAELTFGYGLTCADLGQSPKPWTQVTKRLTAAGWIGKKNSKGNKVWRPPSS
jgi:putative DNA primase/helicase